MGLIALMVALVLLVVSAPWLSHLLGRAAGWPLAAGLIGAAAWTAAMYPGFSTERASVAWMPTFDVALRLRLDGLAFLFLLVILVVGAIVLAYSTAYLTEHRPAGFYALMTGFAAAMALLVLADDLVLLFVAWELTTLCSYLLILRSGPHAGLPATRTLIVTAAGGLCLLGAVVTIAVHTGSTDLSAALAHPAWADDPVFAGSVAVLVALAAMTKSAQFPFHAWLPDAMVAPAPVSAYLHAAAMVKAGIYLLLRFAPAASQSAVWGPTLITVGLLTAVMGAVFALQRTDLKELLAYSTVSQLGLLVAVIGVGTPEAMLAASIHVVAHALFKSAAFLHVGYLEKRLGTRDLRELSGLARSLPWDAAMIVLAAASMAGLPPLLGFASKELILDALLHGPAGWLLALVATAGAVLTVAYSARLVVTTLPGPARESRGGLTAPMSLAISASALLGAGFGVAVSALDGLVAPAAAVAAGTNAEAIPALHLWHGLTVPLLLSATAIGLGLLLSVRRFAVDAALDRGLFPVTGVGVTQAAMEATITGGRRVGDLTRRDGPAAHLAVPIVMIGVAAIGVLVVWPGTLPFRGRPYGLDVLLLVLVVAGVVIATAARSRLMAVIAVGLAGFTVAVWFYALGASDVAITQLMVEILTMVVMALALRRLRPALPAPSSRRRTAALAAAVAAGVTATLATLAFTGHRPLSPAGEYFLREAENDTGGTNVVNTILVDFRALDTLGELVVLAIGALAVAALLHARKPVQPRGLPAADDSPLAEPRLNAVFLTALDRVLVPLMLLGSAYALLRGHNAPGGGFIAALVGAAALALAYLSAPSDDVPRLYRPYLAIAGMGIAVAVATGLLGFAEGSFLRPLHAYALGQHLTTALVFDLGVYLAVFGVILAALTLMGTPARPGSSPDAQPLVRRPRRSQRSGR